VTACRERIDVALAGEGVGAAARADATARVLGVLGRTLDDARGRWLFAPTHDDAKSEWALAGFHEGAVDHVTLDRTFVADGVRWIVDFKTGRHEGGDATTFLDREQERYRAQLERYARIVRGLDARPIRLALYFPLVDGGWREWCCDAA
jgi:ATP-dependent exoDNAse (exonuclease V) beta subunit